MIVAGSLLMLTAVGPSGAVLQKTDDGVASASFPGAPERRFLSASETPDGAERETYDYKPPGRDLNYKLSRSPITGPAVEWSDDERVDAMIAYFESQKVAVSGRTSIKAGEITGHAFSFTSPDGSATSSIRVAFAGGQAYRVIATAGKNESAPAEFEQFLSSFRVTPGRR
jgi:hypothetical protein